jgi:hypothetical protein
LPLEGQKGTGGATATGGRGFAAGAGGSGGPPSNAASGSGGQPNNTAGAATGSAGLGNAGASSGPTARSVSLEIDGDPKGTFGTDLAFVGDLDGDGFADLAVLDGGGSGPDRALAVDTRGAVYVFYGRAEVPSQLQAADADFILDGAGHKVTALGDFDGDGFDDFAFVADCQTNDCDPTRGLHVVFGGAERLAGEHRSDEIGVTWNGAQGDAFYGNVRGVGDVNGDGRADLLVDAGTIGNAPNVVTSHLLLGRSDRTAIATAMPDAKFEGRSGDYRVDFGAAPAGDVDGDGYDDVLIATTNTNPDVFTGTIALFYGGRDRLQGSLSPGDADATFAWQPSWATLGDLGDLDGDGYADLSLSAQNPNGEPNTTYVVYGRAERFSGSYGQEAAQTSIVTVGQMSGLASGDVNGDGVRDIVVGDRDANNGQGWLALIPGTLGARLGTYEVSEADVILHGDRRPAEVPGIGVPSLDSLGAAVAAGDFDGDGVDDVLVGAPTNGVGDLDGGRAFLLFGRRSAKP